MPALDPETPRAKAAIKAVVDRSCDQPIEDALVDLAHEAEAAQRRLDQAMSLARNWLGLPDARIAELIGVAPTTVARRDSVDIRSSVTDIVIDDRRSK